MAGVTIAGYTAWRVLDGFSQIETRDVGRGGDGGKIVRSTPVDSVAAVSQRFGAGPSAAPLSGPTGSETGLASSAESEATVPLSGDPASLPGLADDADTPFGATFDPSLFVPFEEDPSLREALAELLESDDPAVRAEAQALAREWLGEDF